MFRCFREKESESGDAVDCVGPEMVGLWNILSRQFGNENLVIFFLVTEIHDAIFFVAMFTPYIIFAFHVYIT